MASEKISISLPPDMLVQLRKRAGIMERPASWVIQRALDAYLRKPYVTRIKARRNAPR